MKKVIPTQGMPLESRARKQFVCVIPFCASYFSTGEISTARTAADGTAAADTCAAAADHAERTPYPADDNGTEQLR